MTKEEILFCYPQGESEPYGHVPVNRIYEAMDRWANEKLGAYISGQESVTHTTVVPKYILDQYAKQEAIEFGKWAGKNGYVYYPDLNEFTHEEEHDLSPDEAYEKFIQSKETNNG